MDTKLEVIRLNNKDVIATSCNNVWGVARVDYNNERSEYQFDVIQNGTNNENVDISRYYQFATKSVGTAFNNNGYYHVNGSGTIIEKCPYTEMEDIFEHHSIDLTN